MPVKVFAHDESRVGVWPIVRRRMTACGVQPIATVVSTFDSFYLYGAVEPTTGVSFFLELPGRNTDLFQVCVDGCAAAFPDADNLLVLDNGAFHKAKALRWPSHVVPVLLPPYSPALNPIERIWRDLKDRQADSTAKTIAVLSDAVCSIMQHYVPSRLQSLTGFAYSVQAVETAQKALYV